MSLKETLRNRSREFRMFECIAAVLVIGVTDAATGWDLSLYLFYAGPILYSAWYISRRFTIAIGLLAGIAWGLANFPGHRYESTVAYLWVAFSRLVYMVIVAVGGTALRESQRHLHERMAALARARDLERELVRIVEHQQMQLGQELHDGACQNLAAIDCALGCLQVDLTERGVPESESVSTVQKMVQRTISEIRSLARGAFPVHMEELGLSAAISELARTIQRSYGVPVDLELPAHIPMPNLELGMHIFRLLQEALSNAARHSGASLIRVAVEATDQQLVLEVSDNGRGFSPSEVKKGMGLQTMRYRADLIGAKFEHAANGESGTKLTCTVPLLVGSPNKAG